MLVHNLCDEIFSYMYVYVHVLWSSIYISSYAHDNCIVELHTYICMYNLHRRRQQSHNLLRRILCEIIHVNYKIKL